MGTHANAVFEILYVATHADYPNVPITLDYSID
jgi:hypothetical protein